MTEVKLAIALSRVSSDEQIKNNSINRQNESIIKGAEKLGVRIPKDGWWSGRQSSKKGTNLNRKDIDQMLNYCRRNKAVKYLLIDRPDRFMRSVKEAIYFEVRFELLGVKVWYTKDQELNRDRLSSEFMKFSKYFDAEGSNEDRIEQSLGGALKALQEGRYPFPPKRGYMRSMRAGLHVKDESKAPFIQEALLNVLSGKHTPLQALKIFNQSDYFTIKKSSPYKMDKFRSMCTDPYYAGVVLGNKQVVYRNENGLHEPLITLAQHREIVGIFDNKPKLQNGPLKEGNPKYPLNKILSCKKCSEIKIGLYVGFDHTNGKSDRVWEKYRCRSCGTYFLRKELHEKISEHINSLQLSPIAKNLLIETLKDIWKQEKIDARRNIVKLELQISKLKEKIRTSAIAAIQPENLSLKNALLEAVEIDEKEVQSQSEKLEHLENQTELDQTDFLNFAYGFVEDMGKNFLELNKEEISRCKQILFPGELSVSPDGIVYTPQISPLITLAAKKKSTEVLDNSLMVRVQGL